VVEPIVATEVFELVHVPAPPELESALVTPVQIPRVPAIEPGDAFTANVAVVKQPPAV
jgi:hypothetical protein